LEEQVVSEHGHPPDGEGAAPSTILGKVANGIEGFIRPIYRWLGYLGALAIGLLVVAMIYSAIGRYVNHPLNGSTDIIEMGLLVMIALAMGIEHMGHEKMTVDAVSRLLPKKMQAVIAPVIFALVIVILVVAIWQLIKLGIKIQDRGELTKDVLHLPKYPFVYLITFGVFTLVPIYLARFLASIDRLVKR
jgi:TRAP-type C4-dicarboxylate transport system permease small subunit